MSKSIRLNVTLTFEDEIKSPTKEDGTILTGSWRS